MSNPGTALAGRCYHCGGEIPSGDPFCGMCGVAAADLAVAAPARAASPVSEAPPVPSIVVTSPATGGPALTLGTAPLGGRPAPLGRTAWIAIAAVVALIVAAGGVVLATRLLAPTPRSTVEDYFAAVADGDADGALALVSGVPPDLTEFPLLSGAALADGSLRPSDVEIGDAGEVEDVFADVAGGMRVPVTYRAGGRTVQQDIYVQENEDGFEVYNPFVALTVNGAAGRDLTVNGVAVGNEDLEVYAFPGAFRVTAAANALWAESVLETAPETGLFGMPSASADLGRPRLAATAAAAIDQQVRTTLDSCAARTDAYPVGCPFSTYIWGSDISVRWTITTYPTVTAEAGGVFGGVSISDDGRGVAHYEASYTDFSGARQTESGDDQFRVNGTADLQGSDIIITLY